MKTINIIVSLVLFSSCTKEVEVEETKLTPYEEQQIRSENSLKKLKSTSHADLGALHEDSNYELNFEEQDADKNKETP